MVANLTGKKEKIFRQRLVFCCSQVVSVTSASEKKKFKTTIRSKLGSLKTNSSENINFKNGIVAKERYVKNTQLCNNVKK